MMKVKVVRACGERHKQYLGLNYRQITPERYIEKFERGFYFVIEKEETGQPFGWLRYGFFWDSEPFVNMLVGLFPVCRWAGSAAGTDFVRSPPSSMLLLLLFRLVSSVVCVAHRRKVSWKWIWSTIGDGMGERHAYRTARHSCDDKLSIGRAGL